MKFSKTLTVASALALSVALVSLSGVKAASLVGPGSQPAVEGLATTVAAKKEKSSHKSMRHHRKHHRMHHRGKRMHSKGPGRCGMNMYYSRKHGHCMDARSK